MPQPGQARRSRALRKELARMRIESEHGRRQAQVLGGFDEPRQHRLMAAMDTVEVADRQCDRTLRLCRKSSMYMHPENPGAARPEPMLWQRRMRRGKLRQKLELYQFSQAPPE